MRSKLGDRERLNHILDACEKILIATRNYSEEKFIEDFIVNAAVCRFISIIGEASANITPEFKKVNPQFDWVLVKGMRNIIVHEYFGVDDHKLYETVVNDIPKLKVDCEKALKEFA